MAAMVAHGAGPRTLEQAIVEALAAGDASRAVVMLRRAFGREEDAGSADLVELVEELAEHFAEAGRAEDAVATAASALLITPDDRTALRLRSRIAELLLRAGLGEEACAVYASVAETAGHETWVHEAAGSDYLDVGDHELAFAWLTAGLERAVAAGELDCVARLSGLRREAMDVLDLPRDELDGAAAALLWGSRPRRSDADDLELLVELDGEGVAPDRAARLLTALRRPGPPR